MSSDLIGPADAKKFLYRALMKDGVRSVASYVAHDIANVRRSSSSDGAFVNALLAIAKEISNALASPFEYGVALEHDLGAWRRSKFPSVAGEKSDLRLVFRPGTPTGIELLAFGTRAFPDSVYHTAHRRV